MTVAYCRVSTEEQATEGFSIGGQADKLRVYAELHDLGEVVVIADPGRSGKDLDRPGLQQVSEGDLNSDGSGPAESATVHLSRSGPLSSAPFVLPHPTESQLSAGVWCTSGGHIFEKRLAAFNEAPEQSADRWCEIR